VAAENIDNTINGTGLFPAKVPGLSDAADIQAALKLYHYGSYTYDGSNTNTANLVVPSIAKHLQNLVDADAAEVVNRNAAIAVETTNRNTAISNHNAATTNVHGIANTLNLATKAYVDSEIIDAIDGTTGAYVELAGVGLEWNSIDDQFDVEPKIANSGTVITKTSDFTLDANDVSKTILLNTSSSMTLTIPSNSSVEIPIGYHYNFLEIGTGRTTFFAAPAVSVGSKNGQLFLDGRYSKGTLVKISTNDWVLFGDIYEGVAASPTPVAPTPVAPTPASPTPVAPTPTAPTPVAPTPVEPTPVAPTPVAPTPVEPTPTPVSPVLPTAPTLPTPQISVYRGWQVYPGSVYATFDVTNDSSYPYPYTYTSTLGTQNVEFPEQFIAENLTPNQSYTVYITVSKPGYTSATGSATFNATPAENPTPVAPTPTAPTPTAPTPIVTPVAPTLSCPPPGDTSGSFSDPCSDDPTKCCNSDGVPYVPPTPTAPTPTAPTPIAPTPTSNLTTYYGCCADGSGAIGQYANSSAAVTGLNNFCQLEAMSTLSGGVYTTPQSCNPAPTPVAPTPVAPTPVAPTPTAPTPTAPTYGPGCYYASNDEQCPGTFNPDNNECCPAAEPTPVAPTPVAPTPVAPAPVAPTPVAPTPTAWATPLSGWHQCTSADAPNPNMPSCNYGNIGTCVNNSATGASCTDPTAPTPTAPTPVAPTPVAPTPTAPTPTAPTPTSSYGPGCYYASNDEQCPGTFNNDTNECCPSAAPTPAAPTPVAPTPTAPTPTAPTPTAPTPTAPAGNTCETNCYWCDPVLVPCPPNVCVYICGGFIGYTST